jgi:acyl-CoA thioester hydrolase
MPDLSITYRGTVHSWNCDHMNHMNVMWYVGKFDEATWQFFSSIGLSRSRLSKEGAGMAAVEQRIEYKRELRAGDLITIRSAALEITKKSIRFYHEMSNDETGELAACTILVAVYFDTSARKSRPIPADISERVGLMLTPAAPGL